MYGLIIKFIMFNIFMELGVLLLYIKIVIKCILNRNLMMIYYMVQCLTLILLFYSMKKKTDLFLCVLHFNFNYDYKYFLAVNFLFIIYVKSQ